MTTTPILQFGTSRFLQAHADLFISQALARGADQALGPVTVVQSSGDATRGRRLAALADPAGYVVRLRGLHRGRTVETEERGTAIVRALSTATDWPQICDIATQEARIILSNAGDAGWAPCPADTAATFDQAMSYPAKLTHLLRARWQGGGGPVQVMPTELIPRNGAVLRDRVLALARGVSPALADWIGADVTFVTSLVDRIVSAPLEPAGAVAEPYALWAIEDCPGLILPCRHPDVQVVPALDGIARQKLHILNLGHTWMVARWLAGGGAGDPLVRQMMADPAARTALEHLYATEVLPSFAVAGAGADAADYVRVTLDRFANPYLDHRLVDIAQNHPEKLRRRVGAFLDWTASLNLPRPPALSALMDGA